MLTGLIVTSLTLIPWYVVPAGHNSKPAQQQLRLNNSAAAQAKAHWRILESIHDRPSKHYIIAQQIKHKTSSL